MSTVLTLTVNYKISKLSFGSLVDSRSEQMQSWKTSRELGRKSGASQYREGRYARPSIVNAARPLSMFTPQSPLT